MTTPIPYSPKTPDVVIAFDQSGSMKQAFGSGTRFSAVRAALKPLVSRYQDRVRWGYEEFPSDGDGTGCAASLVCVSPALMNAAAVNAAIDGAGPNCPAGPAPPPPPPTCPAGYTLMGNQCCMSSGFGTSCMGLPGAPGGGGTPTPVGLRHVRDFYSSFMDGIKERYVLLSTDGEPNCGVSGAGDITKICSEAVDQIKMLLADGVKTIVLGVSEEVAEELSNVVDRGVIKRRPSGASPWS
jgi:hypothetical protein